MKMDSERIPENFCRSFNMANGTEFTIRTIKPTDARIEQDFVRRLSAKTRYYRFFGGVNDLTPNMVDYFTNIDFSKHMALIAVTRNPDGTESEIAVARYFQLQEKNSCEFAVVVEDKFHNQGVGHKLMELLIQDAKAKGYSTMEGEIIAENRQMQSFVRELGFKIIREQSGGAALKAILPLDSEQPSTT